MAILRIYVQAIKSLSRDYKVKTKVGASLIAKFLNIFIKYTII